MKKNVYVRSVLWRENKIKQAILDFFMAMWSFPRMLLEVFLRVKFGHRYFNLGTALCVGLLVGIIPLATHSDPVLGFGGGLDGRTVLLHYGTWYVYLAFYVWLCFRHYRELKSAPSYFELDRYSKSAGLPLLVLIIDASTRNIEIYAEPLVFIIAGIVLMIFQQPLGLLLIICAVIYGLSYAAQYHEGDTFMWDRIDAKKINAQLEDIFVEDKDPRDTKGINMRMGRPGDKDQRRDMLDMFYEDNDDDDDDDDPEVA